MKLGLGTAQFGLDYGISNDKGKIALSEAQRILELARASDIALIDTAPTYGDSEAVLGELLSGDDAHFQLVTKTLPIDGNDVSKMLDSMESTFKESLAKLRVKSVYGLLVHHADDLLAAGGKQLVHRLQKLVQEKFILKIGVSVYNGVQIDRVLDLFKPDIIQLPLSLFDQRLIESGHLKRLSDLNIEIHARSIFLQGLLLMDGKIPHPYFASAQAQFSHYQTVVAREGLTPLEMAVHFVLEHDEIAKALIGVTSVSELREIIKVSQKPRMHRRDWHSFAMHDENVLNPSLWRLNR